jgi:alkylated DNA repair dioxygenase AlkB
MKMESKTYIQTYIQHKDSEIQGLSYMPNFISQEEEKELLLIIDSKPWDTTLKRRTQQYGYKYDYSGTNNTSVKQHIGPLPSWLDFLQQRLKMKFDQVIINEYEPGQGISAHIDSKMFGNVIISVSLGSHTTMKFKNVYSKEEREMLLQPLSALVLTDKARYEWLHSIPCRKKDDGKERGRRVSITFRTVL